MVYKLYFRLKKWAATNRTRLKYLLVLVILSLFISAMWIFYQNYADLQLSLLLKTYLNCLVSHLNWFWNICVDYYIQLPLHISIWVISLQYTFILLFVTFGLLFMLVAITNLFFLSFLGLYGVFFCSVISLFLFWVSSVLLYFLILQSNLCFKLNLGSWFFLMKNFQVHLDLFIDHLSITYILLILTISLFVQFYTFSYFRFEPLTDRLILFLNLFIISMILLVTAGNIIVLFLGWELIGLTSFVLINFWVTRKSTLKAAYKAFVFNKFSDGSFLFVLILFVVCFQEIDICVIINQAYLLNNQTICILFFEISIIEVVTAFLLITACIKSAQFGGHLWLPDSMEAPVPASALIHSATLVSAGLFLLLRFNVFFELSNYTYYAIPFIGAVTSFYGGLCAAFQSDVKRILAYSTISHCGFLVTSFTTHLFDFTLFYLYVHGFFKAGVFLCVGNVIRFGGGYQDFRRMGQFSKYLPFETFLAAIGLFNLAGIPFSLGFYMKHYFFTSLNLNFYATASVVYILSLIGALTGVFYSFKLYYYVFFDFKKSKKNVYTKNLSEQLKSRYFSNTSLASNVSILSLFTFAYIIIFHAFYLLSNKYFIISDSVLVENTKWILLNVTNDNFLWNVSYINWFVLLNLVSVLTNYWRKITNFTIVYKNTLIWFYKLTSIMFFTRILSTYTFFFVV